MGIFDAASLPSGPTSKQISSADVQSWAQPYVNSYLSRSQALANQAPTAFQNQVASSAQNMGMPEQFAMGTNLANQGGQGQLSTAPMALNYGQMGAGIGSQGLGIGALGQAYGFGAGQNYVNQATNPYAVGAFMNPYVQQSLKPQLDILNQQQQLQAQDINARAAGQGAFGGNRATLAQGLNAQNFDLARQQAIGQGYNQAFQNAQQAQQFGANLGLQGAQMGVQSGLQGLASGMQGVGLGLQGVQGAQQGYSGATQAGATLGQIGAQQGQYELAKLALQNQIANQQYLQPFQQQQFMQGMLSGLPITSGTTTGFQAPPNALSQMAGIGTTLIGGYGALNKAGLIPSFGRSGGSTPTNPYAGSIESGGAKTGEVWGSPGTIDTSYGTGNAYGNMTSDEISNMQEFGVAKGGQITRNGVKRYASGGVASLMQMRPSDQENYTGFSNTGGGPLNQIRLSDQENYTGFSNSGGGPLDQLRPTDQENYTGFGAGMSPQVSSAMGAGLSGFMPRASVVDQTPVSSDELANLYQQYLGRGVDASGAKSFTGLDRTSVLNAIINSPEYQSRGVSVPNVPITHNVLLSAKGGQIKSYASGGLVSLALTKALKG